MIYGKAIAIIVTLCGIIYGLTNLIILAKCILSKKVPATIIGHRGNGKNGGIHQFIYRVLAAPGVVLQLEREVMPLSSILPFYSIDNYVGREIMVPFDTQKQKLLPHEPILIVKLGLSIVATALGIVMLIMLAKLQYYSEHI